ncbi:MAG: alpha/beta fold hydrolase [Rubrivivax sp.]|nr:alpha/beta fold hydrolase [Rubrivivax sp.]
MVEPKSGACGDGDPCRPCLLMIPGSFCDERLFAAQVRALNRKARLISADFSRLRDREAWLARLLQRLPERFSVVGFSLGGLIALELLRRAPERVERLAMIASNAEAATRRTDLRTRAQWRLWRQHGPLAALQPVWPNYFGRARRLTRERALVRRMAQATPAKSARAQLTWAAERPQGRSTLASFQAPLLIVSGRRDRLCPRSAQQHMLRAQPHARWHELRHCGHLIPLEAPRRLGRLLACWLAEPSDVSPRSSS